MLVMRQAILRSLFPLGMILSTMLVAACGGSVTPSAGSVGSGQQTSAAPARVMPPAFEFITINNPKDLTFNQLLGINDPGTISGYFGSGAAGHPNKGYTIKPAYKRFKNQNYPGSVQTQVTAINDFGETAGFWIDGANVNRGYTFTHGTFHSYADPNAGTVTQILGLNNLGRAVGFYTDTSGVNHGVILNLANGRFRDITPPGASNVAASAINDANDISGFYTSGNRTISFMKTGETYTTFHYPKSKTTMAFGINNLKTIVGAYVDHTGATHGFILTSPLRNPMFVSVDDPNAVGMTVINGLNNRGQFVGFYMDSAGNTDGMLIRPH